MILKSSDRSMLVCWSLASKDNAISVLDHGLTPDHNGLPPGPLQMLSDHIFNLDPAVQELKIQGCPLEEKIHHCLLHTQKRLTLLHDVQLIF